MPISSYLSVTNTPQDNLKCIVIHSAYQTEEKRRSGRDLENSYYGIQKLICLISIVAMVALSAILGGTVNYYCFFIAPASLVFVYLWRRFYLKEVVRENLDDIEREISLRLIKEVGEYLADCRRNKINYLFEECSKYDVNYKKAVAILEKNKKAEKKEVTLKETYKCYRQVAENLEENFNKKERYVSLCEEAKSAYKKISKHYGPHYIGDFTMDCKSLYDETVEKEVIVLRKTNKELKFEKKIAVSHWGDSVIATQETRLRTDLPSFTCDVA